jgi:hypothetical protein
VLFRGMHRAIGRRADERNADVTGPENEDRSDRF